MHTLIPAFGLSMDALKGDDGFCQLHETFLSFLADQDEDLHINYTRLCAAQRPVTSDDLMYLAPIVGAFFHCLFGHTESMAGHHRRMVMRHTLKVRFMRRRVAVKNPETLTHGPSHQIRRDMAALLGGDGWSDDLFTDRVLMWLSQEEIYKKAIETAIAYGRFALYTPEGRAIHGQGIFNLPKRHGEEGLTLNLKTKGTNRYQTGLTPHMDLSFDLQDRGLSLDNAVLESHYCLHCHGAQKDSCRTGLTSRPPKSPNGCPMDQKISEMMMLMSRGEMVGAFAAAMLDNPFLPLTGHRICHDCRASCIFQKQDPVEVPGSETALLRHVLNLPWGFEIYRILTLWNPLNTAAPLPRPPSPYTVLVVGTGPSGIALSHYLLRAGHHVIAIDGLKIDPLPRPLKEADFIRDSAIFFGPLSAKPMGGFGGVGQYGITHRWDKNFLNLMQLLLERHGRFSLFGSTSFGTMVDQEVAKSWGVDHIALCMGAGGPKVLPLTARSMPPGVRYASDFLMALGMGGIFKSDPLKPYEIRLPLVVVGGGLTAIDAAVEGVRYYGKMVLTLHGRFKDGIPPGFLKSLSPGEQERLWEYLTHGKALAGANDPLSLLQSWGGARILYRGFLKDAPSYTTNSPEVQFALDQGILFQEKTDVQHFHIDDHGWVSGVQCGEEIIPAKTVLIAVGCDPHDGLDLPKSRFGDMDPRYRGSVVKALASAKQGYGALCRRLESEKPRAKNPPAVLNAVRRDLTARVVSVTSLTPDSVEIIVKAPLAARRYQPGQFFRLQMGNDPQNAMEPLALTGAWSDRATGTVGLVVGVSGRSSSYGASLKPGDAVSLMGPQGNGAFIPSHQPVILIGSGVRCAVLPALGSAMKAAGCAVTIVADFHSKDRVFYKDRLKKACDQLILIHEMGLIDVLNTLSFQDNTHLMVVGDTAMMAEVQRFLSGKKYPESAMGTLNSPMQCMMGGLCGQCLQPAADGRLIFSCRRQDQHLSHIDFPFLENRLTQNTLVEKIAQLSN